MKAPCAFLLILPTLLCGKAENTSYCGREDALFLLQVQLKFTANRSKLHSLSVKDHVYGLHPQEQASRAFLHHQHEASAHRVAASAEASSSDRVHKLVALEHAETHLRAHHGHKHEHATPHKHFPAHEKFACNVMLLMLCSICFCGNALRTAVGEQQAAAINLVLSLIMFFYLIFSGIYSAWWNGDPGMGLACKIMCIWVLLQIIILIALLVCMCCMVGVFVGVAIIVKNEMIKKLKEDYEKKEKNLSGPRREYYQSSLFKDKCDTAFDRADKTRSGVLNMSELEGAVKRMLGDDAGPMAPIMKELFDENGNSQVERDEFSEMMKFLSVMQLEDGRFNKEQAFEVLLLPETATMNDVNRSYRKLAIKYHPDKRPNEDKALVDKDMSEINDAKALLEKHFAEKNESKSKDG